MLDKAKLVKTLQHVLRLLLYERYAELERFTNSNRLSAKELESAVKEYPQQLAAPPESYLSQLEVIETSDANPGKWYVDVDLWTVNGQRSDLTLSLTMIDTNSDLFEIEIDNLHVL